MASKNIDKLTVAELKNELKGLGLSVDGLRGDLLARYKEAIANNKEADNTQSTETTSEQEEEGSSNKTTTTTTQSEASSPTTTESTSESNQNNHSLEDDLPSNDNNTSESSSSTSSSESSSSSSSSSRKREQPESTHSPSSSSSSGRKAGCFLVSIPGSVSDESIRDLLEKYGELEQFAIDRSKNRAVVIFKREADAIEARRRSKDAFWPGTKNSKVKLHERTEKVVFEQLAILNGTALPSSSSSSSSSSENTKRRRTLNGSSANKWPEVCPEVGESEWTEVLHIQHLQRPFTNEKLREMLETHGKVSDIWLNEIKTHCFVVFESPQQAEDARKAIYALKWPAPTSPAIYGSFSTLEKMKKAASDEALGVVAPEQEDHDGPDHSDDEEDEDEEEEEEARDEHQPTERGRDSRRPSAPLRELYFKTNTTPQIWWKPRDRRPPPHLAQAQKKHRNRHGRR